MTIPRLKKENPNKFTYAPREKLLFIMHFKFSKKKKCILVVLKKNILRSANVLRA